MKKVVLFLLFIWSTSPVFAQDFSKYRKETFIAGKDTLKYRALYPENYDASKKYPVVIVLHGSGERGSDNEKQLTHGGNLFLKEEIRSKFPSIVIFPQCPENSFWSNVEFEVINTKRFFNFKQDGEPTAAMRSLLKFTDYFLRQPMVDQSQIYVGGLSMGGMGTFDILRRRPKTFAAAFSICGGDNIANCKKYQNIPLWIFHGGLDDVVNPQFSYDVYKQLKDLGHTPKFTIYPKANHNSWDDTFAEPELLPWLFGNKK